MANDLKNQELAYNRRLQEHFQLVRRLKGWTQQEAAAFLGMGEDAYQKMETRAGSKPSAWHIERLRIIIGIDIAKHDAAEIAEAITPARRSGTR